MLLPAIVLEGLHFDVLLGVNWIAKENAVIDIKKGTLKIGEVESKLKPFPEP